MTITARPDRPQGRGADRKQLILRAAAELVAARGYHDVGMTEIGAAAGVTGSAIYRHFDGKSAVLVALFDRVIDNLTSEASEIVRSGGEPQDVLRRLVASQVGFILDERTLAQVYYSEIHNLPQDDSHRLRRKQRLYIEEWVHTLGLIRPTDSDGALRTRVHAAIGAVQSVLNYHSGLPATDLAELMQTLAEATLYSPHSTRTRN